MKLTDEQYSKFLDEHAANVYDGSNDPDHPACPQCGATMEFIALSDDPLDAYWSCPDCDFEFSMEEISDHIDY